MRIYKNLDIFHIHNAQIHLRIQFYVLESQQESFKSTKIFNQPSQFSKQYKNTKLNLLKGIKCSLFLESSHSELFNFNFLSQLILT